MTLCRLQHCTTAGTVLPGYMMVNLTGGSGSTARMPAPCPPDTFSPVWRGLEDANECMPCAEGTTSDGDEGLWSPCGRKGGSVACLYRPRFDCTPFNACGAFPKQIPGMLQ
jgi:hypothetical protein